jgi:hypothetical protein
MKINIFLISPGLKYQDAFRDAMDLIEKSDINLDVNEVTPYTYRPDKNKSNTLAFKSMFTFDWFKKKNQSRVKALAKLGVNDPYAKFYDIVVVIGQLDPETMQHLILCWQNRMFKKILVIDPEADEQYFYGWTPPAVYFDEFGNYAKDPNQLTKVVDSIQVRLGQFTQNLSSFKSIAIDFLSMYVDEIQVNDFKTKYAA